MTKGWCKRNYFHTDGKRRFGELINDLCLECRFNNISTPANQEILETMKHPDSPPETIQQWKERHQKLLQAHKNLEHENKKLRAERDRLIAQLQTLSPNQTVKAEIDKCREIELGIEEYHQKMNKLYQEQTRRQYQQYKTQSNP